MKRLPDVLKRKTGLLPKMCKKCGEYKDYRGGCMNPTCEDFIDYYGIKNKNEKP